MYGTGRPATKVHYVTRARECLCSKRSKWSRRVKKKQTHTSIMSNGGTSVVRFRTTCCMYNFTDFKSNIQYALNSLPTLVLPDLNVLYAYSNITNRTRHTRFIIVAISARPLRNSTQRFFRDEIPHPAGTGNFSYFRIPLVVVSMKSCRANVNLT